MMWNKAVLAVVGIAAAVGLAWFLRPAPVPPPPEVATVKGAIDAATIELEGGQRVRYVGVNIPKKDECFGEIALAANEKIIGQKVRLEKDEMIDQAKDGVFLRYVFLLPAGPATAVPPAGGAVAPTAGGPPAASPAATTPEPTPEEIFINERIIEGGFGFPLLSKDMKYHERLTGAARYANATGKGLWKACEVYQVSPGVLKTKPK